VYCYVAVKFSKQTDGRKPGPGAILR